jgi:hypothetical protein
MAFPHNRNEVATGVAWPSRKKLTVPVGVTGLGTVGATVAVKVTGEPNIGLGGLATTVVVVAALVTVSDAEPDFAGLRQSHGQRLYARPTCPKPSPPHPGPKGR